MSPTLATEDGRYAEKIRRAAEMLASWSDPDDDGATVIPFPTPTERERRAA